MSYDNFKKALKMAKECEEYDVGKGTSDDIIKIAQEKLGIVFSKQLYNYLKKYSYLEFYGSEFYGILTSDFSGIPEGSIVESAIYNRNNYKLPLKWIPIYNFGDGYKAYLDYENKNTYDEPRVILAIYNEDEFVVTEKLAEDLGDFLLQVVEEQLSNQ